VRRQLQLVISGMKVLARKILAIYYHLHNPPLISLRNSKVLARPGFMGFNGGVFNPGAICLNSEIILLARAERFTQTEREDKTKYLSSCSPLLFRYSNNMVLEESKALSLENYPINKFLRAHDFRLFKFKAFTFVNHTLTDTSSWIDTTFSQWQKRNMEEIVAIAELDLNRCCLQFRGTPKADFKFKRREKNFGFFEHNDNLYLMYSFSPYILLEATDLEKLHFRTVINKEIRIHSLNSINRLVSLSTNPIHYDDKHYLMLIHKKDRFYVYTHWGIMISKESLLPVKITARPLFRGSTSKGTLTSVVYVMSAVSFGDKFRFFLGEGNLYSSYIDITKIQLDETFIPLSSKSIRTQFS
jgi:predicted GH43/DUF377 family glycosyl hydrolase